MIVILSGEGPTDFGKCTNAQGICSEKDYQLGAMAIIVDKMLTERMNYSIRETTPDLFLFVSEAALKEPKDLRKSKNLGRESLDRVSLVGTKQKKEKGYFRINALVLAQIAQNKEQEYNTVAIAILFRDSDTSDAKIWQDKWQSMLNSFQWAGFSRGIPMLPKPKSEAWLICAAKDQPYQHCSSLEDLPGNDDSPNSAKNKLDEIFGRHKSAEELCDWLIENPFDFNACEMPSFLAFKDEFNRVLDDVLC